MGWAKLRATPSTANWTNIYRHGDDDPSPLHSQRMYNGVLGRPTSLLSRKPHITSDGFRDAETVVRKKREEINSLMEQVEATRFPFRMKRLPDTMNLNVDDSP